MPSYELGTVPKHRVGVNNTMSTHENTAPKPDVYQRVTDAIVNAIEAGVGQYRMPWTVRQDKGFSPISVGSAKPYRGINTLVLWAQSQRIYGYWWSWTEMRKPKQEW